MKPTGDDSTQVERLVVECREELLRFVRRRAGGALLRVETAEDLAQAICAHALARERRLDDAELRRGWLFKVAEHYLSDRRDHWSALKRLGAGVMRTSLGDARAAELDGVRDLASSVTGPSTFAARRELLRYAAIALDMLLPRDRELVAGFCRGATVAEQAEELGVSYDAASQARSRAMERFRRCFKLAVGAQGAA